MIRGGRRALRASSQQEDEEACGRQEYRSVHIVKVCGGVYAVI